MNATYKDEESIRHMEIQLTKGFIAIVDDEDYERVNCFKWHVSETKNGLKYARRTIVFTRIDGKQPQIKQFLHRFVLDNFDKNIKIDFKDDNPLNCTKRNLIISNNVCKTYNATRRKSLLLKGVRKRYKKWNSRIFDGEKSIFLGSFSSEEEAFKAYAKKNIELQKLNGAKL
jgi:hypothetical protein